MAINRYLLMFLLGSLLVCSSTAMLAARADTVASRTVTCAVAKHRLHHALATGDAEAIAHARKVKHRACAKPAATCSFVNGVISCHTAGRLE